MEQTLSSETSAFKLQTPGKFPKEHRLHSKHGESLKTTISNMPAKCVAAGQVKHCYLVTASYRQLPSGVTYYELVTNKPYYGNRQSVQPLITYPAECTDLKGETTKRICDRPIRTCAKLLVSDRAGIDRSVVRQQV